VRAKSDESGALVRGLHDPIADLGTSMYNVRAYSIAHFIGREPAGYPADGRAAVRGWYLRIEPSPFTSPASLTDRPLAPPLRPYRLPARSSDRRHHY